MTQYFGLKSSGGGSIPNPTNPQSYVGTGIPYPQGAIREGTQVTDPNTGLYRDPDSITSSNLKSSSFVTLPQLPKPTNYSGTITGNNAALASLMSAGGYTLNPQGQYVYTPKIDGETSEKQSITDKIKEITGLYQPPPNTADIYSQATQEAGIQQKRQVVQSYTNSLNAIVAKAQADQLSVTGQGRGVPEVIIGGQI